MDLPEPLIFAPGTSATLHRLHARLAGAAGRPGPAGKAALGALESGAPAAGGATTPQALIDRVEDLLRRMPADEVTDAAAFRRAMAQLLQHGDVALRRLATAPRPEQADLDSDQRGALEAIVVADGARPSFLLRDGQVAKDHPFLLDWADDVARAAPLLPRLAGAVGRIEPAFGHASRYIGTGTLIDAAKGLVLTNYHVLDDAELLHGVVLQRNAAAVRVVGEMWIDFAGETDSLRRRRCRVVEATLPAGFGRRFGELDVAVLRIEPGPDGGWPEQAARLSADPDHALGASGSLCTIGFPGPPRLETPPGAVIDWDFVVTTLFGNRFGLKRLAPGRMLAPPGTVAEDPSRRVFAHDATTFGGASGSLLFAWGQHDAPAFGLHFHGTTVRANHAFAVATIAHALRALGVPLD